MAASSIPNFLTTSGISGMQSKHPNQNKNLNFWLSQLSHKFSVEIGSFVKKCHALDWNVCAAYMQTSHDCILLNWKIFSYQYGKTTVIYWHYNKLLYVVSPCFVKIAASLPKTWRQKSRPSKGLYFAYLLKYYILFLYEKISKVFSTTAVSLNIK